MSHYPPLSKLTQKPVWPSFDLLYSSDLSNQDKSQLNLPLLDKKNMKRKIHFILCGLVIALSASAQFHRLALPQSSNQVYEKQILGVTEIVVEYASPKVRDREVWNDNDIVPQKGDPIPWRVGANMNTTISFSTEVKLNGQTLKAGKYGLHMIPDQDSFEILFAHNNNLWGSYYLDRAEDVTLTINSKSETCPFSEDLDFEFSQTSDREMTIAVEWADKRIPFTVSVDLEETVVSSLRSELRGIDTYRWEAWNDAAMWCYNHDVNLEEALEWAKRSISGGYGGFAANGNASNHLTKARLEKKLGKVNDYQESIAAMLELDFSASESNSMVSYFIGEKDFEAALSLAEKAGKKFSDVWFVQLNLGVAYYGNGQQKKAIKALEKAKDQAPDSWRERVVSVFDRIKAGTLEL